MAITKVADIVQNNLFFPYVQEDSIAKNALINSGAMVVDPRMVAGLDAGGETFNFRSFQPISSAGSNGYNVSSDDDTSNATANKIVGEKQIVERLDRNGVFASADMTAHMAGTDPMAAIVADIGTYRNRERQLTMLSILKGVMLELNDGVDVAEESIAAQTSASKMSADNFIDSLAPWDDEQPAGMSLVVHGDVHRRMQKDNLIDFAPTSIQDLGWGTYLGATLVVDSTVPKVAGSTDGFKYTSYVLRPGALKFGAVAPKVATAFQREELQADGGGVEYLIVRDAYSVHPFGLSFVGATAGLTATNAEFEAAADWTQIFDRKNIGITQLITN